MIEDLIRVEVDAAVEPAWALSRSMSARVRPAPKAPTLRKFRRCSPSQNVCRRPRNVSMEGSSRGGEKEGGLRAGFQAAIGYYRVRPLEAIEKHESGQRIPVGAEFRFLKLRAGSRHPLLALWHFGLRRYCFHPQ